MGSLFLSGCVDCNGSLSVSLGDVSGSSDAAIPAATSLIPARRLRWPSVLLAAAAPTFFSFMQIPLVDANGARQIRPGRRVVTSWTSHALPSGSLKAQNDP